MTSTTSSPRRSPRKQVTAKKPRAERHCNRCPGRPLLRKCPIHSAAAKSLTRQQENRKNDPKHQANSKHINHRVGAENGSMSSVSAPPTALHTPITSDAEAIRLDPVPMAKSCPMRDPSPAPPMGGIDADIPIDPLLVNECLGASRLDNDDSPSMRIGNTSIEHDQDAPMQPSIVERPSEMLSQALTITFININEDTINLSMDNSHNSDSDSSGSSHSSANRRSRRRGPTRQRKSQTGSQPRVRISGKNAPYGFVDGAFRGLIPWKVPRRRKVEAREPSREHRNKAFTERMAGLLRRCEELSNVTGCWLYISAHIPTYNHDFVHFASSSLIRDADKSMDDVHALHSNMHKSLAQATIRDVAMAEMEAAKARAELQAAKESENATLKNMAGLEQTLQERDLVINHLRSLLTKSGSDLAALAGPVSV